MFHNSIDIASHTLKAAKQKVNEQEKLVMDWFLQHPTAMPTPWQLHEALKQQGHNILITSIRRTLTDLSNSGQLVKSSVMFRGPMGKPNHAWRLNITVKHKRSSVKKSNTKKKQQSAPYPVTQNLFDICR